MSSISNTHPSNPSPSIEQFEEAASKHPEAPTLIHITGQGFRAAKAPRMGLLSMFGLGSYFDEVDKSHKTVEAFKEALKKKYGNTIADYVFAPKVERETLDSGLTSNTIKAVLKQAKALDLLKQEIVATITDESSESQAQDTVWRDVPDIDNTRIFKPATIQLIKKAYCAHFFASSTIRLQYTIINPVQQKSVKQAQRKALKAVESDLNQSKLGIDHVFSSSFPMKAMRAAIENNSEVRDIMNRWVSLHPTEAVYATEAEAHIPPMATASIDTSSKSSDPTQEATPVNVILGERIIDPAFNI